MLIGQVGEHSLLQPVVHPTVEIVDMLACWNLLNLDWIRCINVENKFPQSMMW